MLLFDVSSALSLQCGPSRYVHSRWAVRISGKHGGVPSLTIQHQDGASMPRQCTHANTLEAATICSAVHANSLQ